MPRETGFIKKQVAEITGLNPSKIQFYTDQHLIIPEIDAPKGRGTRRVYSKKNVIEIMILSRLVEKGISLEDSGIFLVSLNAGREIMEKVDREHNPWNFTNWLKKDCIYIVIHKKKVGGSVASIEMFDAEDSITLSISSATEIVYVIDITDLKKFIKEG